MKVKSFSDVELLGVLVGESDARALLQDGLSSLARCMATKVREGEPVGKTLRLSEDRMGGMPEPRALDKLSAALEFASRVLVIEAAEKPIFKDINTVARLLRLEIGDLPYEVFYCLFLDPHMKLLHKEELFRGSIGEASVSIREVIKRCLDLGAGAIVVSHNHPSGAISPSAADIRLTKSLTTALKSVNVHLVDHLIVGQSTAAYSIRSNRQFAM